MSEEIETLKIYADPECTMPISTIEWNNSVKITLVDGTEKVIPNCARAGESATATVWIKNESPFDYGITRISFSDPRVQVALSSSWIYPSRPTSLTLSFPVPNNPTKADIIPAGKVIIEGYYIYKYVQ
jgi:hypothetical protein